MIEPETPVTLRISYPRRPAVLLESDEGKTLPAASVILRYRHLRQQQRIIQSGITPGEGSGSRATRGIIVATPESREPASITADRIGSSPPSAIANAPAAPAAPPVPGLAAPPLPLHPHGIVAGSATIGGSNPDATLRTAPARDVRQTRGHLRLDDSVHDKRQSVITSIGPLEITYAWRNLRSRGEKTRGEKTYWFASCATEVLDVPPTLPLVKPGDLYVHTSKNGFKQAWLRATTSTWTSVDLLHPHPYLRGYVLNFLKNGEPSWVTKDTVRTYKGRIEKQAREGKKA